MSSRDDAHPARLQPALENHNMSAGGVFGDSSTVLGPPGSFPLDGQDVTVETGGFPLHEASAAGTYSAISNGSQSSESLGAARLRKTAKETGTATPHQPLVQDESGHVQSRESIPAARNNVSGHSAPGGIGQVRQHVADPHVASLDLPLASTSEGRGGHGSADTNTFSDVFVSSMGDPDVQINPSRGTITLAASSRSDASGNDPLQQEECLMSDAAASVEELVAGSSASQTPRGIVKPQIGVIPPDHIDDPGSLLGEQGKGEQGAPSQGCTGDVPTATGLDKGAEEVPSVLDTNFDAHQEDAATEGLLELHHGYRQVERPQTRSGSRAGITGYGSTGGYTDGTEKDQTTERKEGGQVPRNDDAEMEMAAPERLGEQSNRSKLEETGFPSNFLPNLSVGSKLDEQKHGEGAASANEPNSIYASQSDTAGGSAQPPLREESATGASPEMEARKNEGLIRTSSEETISLHGGNASSAFGSSSAFTPAAATNGKEEAGIVGSCKGGDLAAADHAAETAESGSRRTAVPNYLSSSKRGRQESEELRLVLGSGEVDDGSMLNAAQLDMQSARDPPSSRRTAGRNDVLSSIAVAGKKMSIDSENAGGHRRGTAVGSNNTARGKKSVAAKSREGGETLRRLSSSGVWRYDDLEQRQRQHPRNELPTASVSVDPPSRGDAGKAFFPAADGQASPGLRIGEHRRHSQQHRRLESTRQMASRSSGTTLAQVSQGASASEEYGGVGGRETVASDSDVCAGETKSGIDLLTREELGLDDASKLTAEYPHIEEAPFGVVGLGATLATSFAGANAARTRQGGTITPQPGPVVEEKFTEAVAKGSPSITNDADVGDTHTDAAAGNGAPNAVAEDVPVKPDRKVECDIGQKEFAAVSSSRGDHDELEIVFNGQDDAEAATAAHAADREKMAVAVARRISDITGTQYGEALAEVRNALLRKDGDEQEEDRRVAEKVGAWLIYC